MSKSVVIITTTPGVRFVKRVKSFKENNYKVIPYSFYRTGTNLPTLNFEYGKLCKISNNYLFRVFPLIKGLLKIKKKHNNQQVIYYFFGFDVALAGTLLKMQNFIYEEGDLAFTYFKSKIIRQIFNSLDKNIIRRSLYTLFTSGGFISYHYPDIKTVPNNILVIPNKLNPEILSQPLLEKREVNLNKIRIGFVGIIRFESIRSFVINFANNFPQHEFHFYGKAAHNYDIDTFRSFNNIYFHGEFNSPVDLPKIYSNIDLLLCSYDTKYENVVYAEPNKIYEAIYYNTPIIVSKNTYLSEKVSTLGIGYSLDPFNEMEIIDFIRNLNYKDINNKIAHCERIPKKDLIDNNDELICRLNTFFNI